MQDTHNQLLRKVFVIKLAGKLIKKFQKTCAFGQIKIFNQINIAVFSLGNLVNILLVDRCRYLAK